MQCPHCGGDTHVLETRYSEFGSRGEYPGTIRRRRQCLACFRRCQTYEIHSNVMGYVKRALLDFSALSIKRIQLRARNFSILESIAKVGWLPLAQRFGIGKTGIYEAIKRARHELRRIATKGAIDPTPGPNRRKLAVRRVYERKANGRIGRSDSTHETSP